MVNEDHVSSVIQNVGASHDGWLNLVPRQYTRTRGEPILVPLAGPRRLLAAFRGISPDERQPISCALIRAGAISEAGAQKDGAENKKRSRVHAKMFARAGLASFVLVTRTRYDRAT